MTSLRSFQNEIEDIHSREVARQRGQIPVAAQGKPPDLVPTGDAEDTGSAHAEEEIQVSVHPRFMVLSEPTFAAPPLHHFARSSRH
jgi:hypothetical protein